MDYLKTFKKEKDGLDLAEDSFVNEEHELWVLCWCVNLSLSKLYAVHVHVHVIRQKNCTQNFKMEITDIF